MNRYSCDHIRTWLFDRNDADVQISQSLRVEIEQHLSNCEACRIFEEQESQLTQWLCQPTSHQQTGPSELGVAQIPMADVAASKESMMYSEAAYDVSPTAVQIEQPDWSKRWLMIAPTIIGVQLILAALLWFYFSNGSPDPVANLGTIRSSSLITNASFSESKKRPLESSNHISLPAGSCAAIDLNQAGQIQVVGPAKLELDWVVEQWKITMLQGQITTNVRSQQSLQVATQLGATRLGPGRHLIAFDQPIASVSTQEQDKQKTPAELMDRAFGAFHSLLQADPDVSMKQAADLLKQAIDHKDVTPAQQNKARFYRAAALSNCDQHKEALAEALRWQKDNPKEKSDVISDIVASAYFELGQTEKAKAVWRKMLKDNPKTPYKPHIEAKLGGKSAPDPKKADRKKDPWGNRSKPPASDKTTYMPTEFNKKQSGGYLVVTVGLDSDNDEHQKFSAVAKSVLAFQQERTGKAALFEFDGIRFADLKKQIGATQPENVLFIIPPRKLDVNFHRRVFMLSPSLDKDIFADFAFGYLTARNGDALKKLWARIEKLHENGLRKKTWIESSVVGGGAKSYVTQNSSGLTPAVQAAGFDGKSLHFGVVEAEPNVLKFVDRELKQLENASVITLWGNGDPQGIWLFDDARNADRSKHWKFDPDKVGSQAEAMPRITADRFRQLKLQSPVVWSGTCHSGACYRVFVEGDIVSTFGTSQKIEVYQMNPDESMCLALIDAGAACLLVPIASNHGFSAYNETTFALANGATLGESIKSTYDDICLQADGPPKLVIAAAGEPPHYHREHIMQGGGANRILIGDPSLALFKPTEIPGESVKVVKQEEGKLIVEVEWQKGFHVRNWNIFGDMRSQSSRVFARWLLPDDVELPDATTLETKVNVVDENSKRLDYQVQAAIESYGGKRYLHLQATTQRRNSGYQYRKATFEIRW